jgi:hypothetical protein
VNPPFHSNPIGMDRLFAFAGMPCTAIPGNFTHSGVGAVCGTKAFRNAATFAWNAANVAPEISTGIDGNTTSA